MNVFHPYQIRFYALEDLEPFFGPFWSRELLKIAYGKEPHHFRLLNDPGFLQQKMKSVSRSITLWDLVHDQDEIRCVLYNLAQEVIYKVRRMGMSGRRISISLYGSDHQTWRYAQTFQCFIDHRRQLFDFIEKNLSQHWQQQFAPIKFKISLKLLKSNKVITPSLLPCWQKHEAIETAMDQITDKYGLFTIRSGRLLDKKKLIQPEVTGFLGDKDYQFNFR
jgi:hypothetical protein